jgi:hypothetical protein
MLLYNLYTILAEVAYYTYDGSNGFLFFIYQRTLFLLIKLFCCKIDGQ